MYIFSYSNRDLNSSLNKTGVAFHSCSNLGGSSSGLVWQPCSVGLLVFVAPPFLGYFLCPRDPTLLTTTSAFCPFGRKKWRRGWLVLFLRLHGPQIVPTIPLIHIGQNLVKQPPLPNLGDWGMQALFYTTRCPLKIQALLLQRKDWVDIGVSVTHIPLWSVSPTAAEVNIVKQWSGHVIQ